jgi:alkylhydroperoxidase family enzyme
MARLPLVATNTADPALRGVFSYFTDRGLDPPDLYRTLGNAPRLLKAWTDFAWPLRNEASMPRGLRELAIMRVAQLTGASFEWQAHAPMAVQHGISQEVLDQLDHWVDIDELGDAEREVLQFTDELTQDLEVDDDTFAALMSRWSSAEIVELTLTVAFYSCVSRVLRGLHIHAD